MNLKDKTIVITGGATGIGSATAIYCAKHGARIVIGDLNIDEGNKTVESIIESGGEAYYLPLDISQEDKVHNFMTSSEKTLGHIDVLINSAGILQGSLVPIEEFDLSVWDSVININQKGTFLAVKHVVPIMKKTGKGVILLIASGAGVAGGSSSLAYGSSKGGVHGLRMSLESQLKEHNIRIHDVCPSSINTPLKLGVIKQQVARIGKAANEKRQIASLGSAEGVGKILAFLASDDADYVKGTIFTD